MRGRGYIGAGAGVGADLGAGALAKAVRRH
jgi:hypothetical protein